LGATVRLLSCCQRPSIGCIVSFSLFQLDFAMAALTWPVNATTSAADVADKEILIRLESPDEYGGPMTVANVIIERLRSQGLAHDTLMTPTQLGVHPGNRSSYGVNIQTIHTLATDILQVGWDWNAVGVGWCVEEDPADGYIEKYNQELAAASGEKLANVATNSIRAGTLTNSHTVLALRALLSAARCDDETLSVGGRMSIATVEAKDPDFAKAARTGWTWVVLHHSTRRLYGNRLFDFLSTAKNIQLQRQESEVQVLLRINSMALEYLARKEAIAWDVIVQACCRSKPPCMDFIPTLIRFAKAFGGGPNAQFLEDLSRFHSKFVPSERFVSGAFYELLTNAVFKKDCQVAQAQREKEEMCCVQNTRVI
jgi:hypothetical protein